MNTAVKKIFFLSALLFMVAGFSLVPSKTAHADNTQWIFSPLYGLPANFFGGPGNSHNMYLYSPGHTDWAMQNIYVRVNYGANVRNLDTGALLTNGATIQQGTRLHYEPDPIANSGSLWQGHVNEGHNGYYGDTQDIYWNANATLPAGFACEADDYLGQVRYDPAGPRGTTLFQSLWAAFSANPPSFSVTHSGTASLTVDPSDPSGRTFTVTSPGTINSSAVFSSTYGKFYSKVGNGASFFGPRYPVTVCTDEGSMMFNRYWEDNAYTDTFNIPSQIIDFDFTVTAIPNTVNPPTI